MSDLALAWDLSEGSADLVRATLLSDLQRSDGLEEAVLVSLFTDRRDPDARLPANGQPADKRGWWADEHGEQGDQIGSRLWRHARGKRTPATLKAMEDDARDALAWMLADKVALRVDVTVEFPADKPGFYTVAVTVHRRGSSPVYLKYALNWAAQLRGP